MKERTITVRGSAKISGTPDWVVIEFDAGSQGKVYETCLNQLRKNTEKLRNKLVSIGFKEEDLKTTQFQIRPEFDWVKSQHVFRGYQASHNIRVEFAFDKEFLNQVLYVLGNSNGEATFSVSFIIKDPEPLKQKALAEAVRNARVKAEVLTAASGVVLGEIKEINYSWSEVHLNPIMCLDAMAEPEMRGSYDITPEDVDVSDSVTVVWAIKQR